MKALAAKIAEHGTQEDEVLDAEWLPASRHRTLTKERVIIVLEMLYQKAVADKGSVTAGIAYLDRILGKPKENLTLDGEANIFAKISDEELVERINNIVKRTTKG